MASFSLDFPDDEILDELGDDIELIDINTQASTPLRGVFEYKYVDEGLGDQVGIHYPTVEVNNDKASLFVKTSKVKFDGKLYRILNQHPADMGKTLIILRSD